jgi:hypothetical protein
MRIILAMLVMPVESELGSISPILKGLPLVNKLLSKKEVM